MPPSRTSSVASSHRRYEGDIESSDDLHEADSPINERPQTHASRTTRKHELGDVTPRPSLRGFASAEKVVMTPVAPPLPSHHTAPTVPPNVASSVPSVLAHHPQPAPTVAVTNPATVTAVPRPSNGTSPAPRALVPFHHEDSSLWPYPRAPLDDRDDIVELDFADTSALSDVDAFERQRQNGRSGAKVTKKDRAKEREEIERSWDVPGSIGTNAASTPARTVKSGSGLAASPSPQPGAPKSGATSVPVKALESCNGGGPATVLPISSKSKAKAKPASNGTNAKVPASNATQANGAASAAIVGAMHSHSQSNGATSLRTTDRNEFVREVLTLIHTDPSFVDRLWTEYRARA
ncbi:hypothetical protein F5148DRAFT_1376260 [Russula earlei]|uniref:Uncharacterized protein n=1 Tax=Russula earlei TaxID=71964 RepID=A0ACC0UAF7_9AGAM|nr:hypothetical protein F5148DRAFT_1376260 [Russula earlei]